jgi:hypothetical protein
LRGLDPVGLVLGLVAAGLLVLSFFLIPSEWVGVLWTALTVIGILLIEYERKRAPHESFDELCKSAILRWQRDNW